jgi:predicted nucleotidyltransferase
MDTKKLLHLLNEHKVRFVIIGATACVAHGFERATKDIDIFAEPTRENFEKVFAALEKFGYDLTDTPIDEALQKKLLFRGYILRTDIHPHVTGIDFETVWKNKVHYTFQGEDVYFASLDDLIQMKKAAGRPRDLEDLRHLKEIRRQLQNNDKT